MGGCRLQLGGSDQWGGNITTGTELIRRVDSGDAFGLVCPLITKADGGKFGKTENGNVWLDRRYTSPYKFYQFWMNVSDEDAEKYIKIFTSLSREEIDGLVLEQKSSPHLRPLQKRLAEELTVMVHSREDYEMAFNASEILFGKSTSQALRSIDEETFLQVFEGVPQFSISRGKLNEGIRAVDLLTDEASVFPSKSEMRKTVQSGGVMINKEKLEAFDEVIGVSHLIGNKYLLAQRGKKRIIFYLLPNSIQTGLSNVKSDQNIWNVKINIILLHCFSRST